MNYDTASAKNRNIIKKKMKSLNELWYCQG